LSQQPQAPFFGVHLKSLRSFRVRTFGLDVTALYAWEQGRRQPERAARVLAGGGQVGCDWQFAPKWLIGIEGAAAWVDIKGSSVDVFTQTSSASILTAVTTTPDRFRRRPISSLA